MIIHEDKGVELDGINVQGFGEYPQKGLPVIIVPEDVPSLVSPTGHMVNGPRILNA
jgi:hypothetical protein